MKYLEFKKINILHVIYSSYKYQKSEVRMSRLEVK